MPEEDINPRTAAAKKFDLSKKVGPFPLYVWVAGGVALLAGAYFLWKKHTASSTAATTPAATTTATGTTTGTGATGTGYQQYWPTTPATPTATTPTTGVVSGTVGSAPGDFMHVPDGPTNQALAAQGITQYAQITPGEFAPLTVDPSTGYAGENLSPWVTYYQIPGGSGGGRSEARPLSVLGHMIRNGARGTV